MGSFDVQGYWGEVTATLDWCEQNYTWSYYIAEMVNTVSNFVTIALAIHGFIQIRKEKLPSRYLIPFVLFAIVGFGSVAFHTSLIFTAQLADELPMIYATSAGLFLLFDTEPGFNGLRPRRSRALMGTVIVFNIAFTYAYLITRDPVFHQFVFGVLVTGNVGRTLYLLRKSAKSDSAAFIPPATRGTISNIFISGVVLFLSGFAVWNLDNIFCGTITTWKDAVGWPLAAILEGHAWWHILTGTATYCQVIGMTYITLLIKDSHKNYEIGYTWGMIPDVRRTRITRPVGEDKIDHPQERK